MKNIRIWFTKTNTCKYISHLDLNRCILRAIHQSKVPFWYTEGFNPHPFITFSSPLTLGVTGLKESFDAKLTDDIISFDSIKLNLNKHLPKDIQIFNVAEPIMKAKELEFAQFNFKLYSDTLAVNQIYDLSTEFINLPQINIDKKTKTKVENINIKEYFSNLYIDQKTNFVEINLVLPAGNTLNINPNLFVQAFSNFSQSDIYFDIARTNLLNQYMQDFV